MLYLFLVMMVAFSSVFAAGEDLTEMFPPSQVLFASFPPYPQTVNSVKFGLNGQPAVCYTIKGTVAVTDSMNTLVDDDEGAFEGYLASSGVIDCRLKKLLICRSLLI